MKKVKIVLKRINDKKEIYEKIVKFDENIKELNLSNQHLIEIPLGLEQFKNLEILYLYKNNISKIRNFDNNINLKELWLDNNQINKIEKLDNNINLNALYLTNNQISKIENLNNNINLQTLDLEDNQITKIENLNKCINLNTLYLSLNQITKIENLDNNINLQTLDLYNNQITKIENLDNNINLKILYLQNNQITKIENIHHLDKLESLSVFEENQNKNIKETKQISLSNKEIELKEIQIQKEIQEELLKQRQEKEYFNNNFEQIKQQFISSNISNDNELII